MTSKLAKSSLAKNLVECLSSTQRHAFIPQIVNHLLEGGAAEKNDFLLSLFVQFCDAEDDAEVIHYLEDIILGSSPNALALDYLAEICIHRPTVWLLAFSKLTEALEKFLSCQQQAMLWMHRVLHDMPGVFPVENIQSTTETSQPVRQTLAEEVRCYLHFFNTIIWSHDELYPLSPAVFLYLLALFDSDNEIVALSARDTAFTLISLINKKDVNLTASIKSGQNPINPAALSTLIWNRVKDMTLNNQEVYAERTALQLRLRWTALPDPWRPSHGVLEQDEYWRSLQQGLRTGFAEQRKTCLYILHLSISLLENDIDSDHMHFSSSTKAAVLSQYERYCAIYETLVISRYINQAEDCLQDLDFLASSQCLVHKSWLYSMLEAAMGPNIQDSIRSFAGRWFTCLTHWPEQGHEDLVHLLEVSYFPWAMQGYLYTSKIIIQNQTCLCKHGQLLVDFLQHLLTNFSDQRATGISRSITRAILRFMVVKGHYLFPYGRAYMLLGLARGLKSTSAVFGTEDTQAILKIAAYDEYLEIVHEFHRNACCRIIELSGHSQVAPHFSDQRQSLYGRRNPLLELQNYSSLGWPERWQIWKSLSQWEFSKSDEQCPGLLQPSVENFVSIVLDSRYGCLRGNCLTVALDYLEEGMLRTGLQTLPKSLYIALEAIWNEVEIQDYPKNMLMRLPQLLLNDTCLGAMTDESSDSQDLRQLVHKVIFELQGLAQNRIYVFGPLAKAIRLAVLRDKHFTKSFPLLEFLVNLSNHPPSPKLEFLLEAAIIPLFEQLPGPTQSLHYEDYYGSREGYGYACVYDMLNRASLEPDNAKLIFDQLLDPWVRQERDIPVVSKWKTTVQLQIMFILLEQAITGASSVNNECQHYFDKFLHILSIEPLSRYRFFIECMMLRLVAQDGELREILLRTIKHYDQSNPKRVSSLIKIAVIAARLDDSAPGYVQEVMTLLIVMAASPKVMIRHEAQWSFPVLWDHALTRRITIVTENPAFAGLNRFIRGLKKYMTPPPGRKIEPLDPVRDMTMCTITQGPFLQLYPPEKERARVADFELIFADRDQMDSVPPARIPLGNLPINTNSSIEYVPADSSEIPVEQTKVEILDRNNEKSTHIQTKGHAWRANALANLSLPEISTSSPRTFIVLVASLIQSPHNLGGLSRVAEIFGAESLHVATQNVLTNKEFLRVSVTSERHLNIQETPLEVNQQDTSKMVGEIEGLAETLLKMKRNGYKIIGIEQTDQSMVLGGKDATKLLTTGATETVLDTPNDLNGHEGRTREQSPKFYGMSTKPKIALVLGSEREGIPAWILKECDACVEIPQVGVTRSLNVQTAAAIVLYEYTKLNRAK